jgi:hypothetical protein
MKTSILVIGFLLFTSLSQSQIIRDMAANPISGDSKGGNYYRKDINNYFGPFIGAWSYVNGNNEFRIYITNLIKEHVIYPEYHIDFYTDALKIRYEKYENGQLIYASPEDEFHSGISKNSGEVTLSFTDYERENTIVPLTLKVVVSGLMTSGGHYNKISFKLNEHERRNTYYDTHPNEPFFSVPDDIEMVWFPQ